MVRILKPQDTDSIYDPTVGSGGFLINSINYVKNHDGNYRNLQLYGQEINLSTWAIAKLNMLLHDAKGATIWKGDTIREPKNIEDGTLMTFDKVIANPPFSLKNWGIDIAENNDFNRFSYGVPPKSYGDLAFVEHMLASVNSKGKLTTVVPHGVLFRGGAEGKIRQGMLEDDLIEAIIGLPANLFYGTGIPAAIIVMNKNKSEEKKDKVLFIDASDGFVKDGNQNRLTEENMERIVEAYEGYQDIEKFSNVIDAKEIKENDWNLNISRYVDISEEEEQIDIEEVVKRIALREEKLSLSKKEINEFLEQLGFGRI